MRANASNAPPLHCARQPHRHTRITQALLAALGRTSYFNLEQSGRKQGAGDVD